MRLALNDYQEPTHDNIAEGVYRAFNEAFGLSRRQTQCLFYIASGFSIKEIANKIDKSPRTIETHINVLKNKLNMHIRSRLVWVYNSISQTYA